MKKKIAILGSTGTIGKILLNIVKNDSKNFEIILLTANKSSEKLLEQAELFNVKNLILNDSDEFKKKKKFFNKKNINVYENFEILDQIFKKKIDYVLSAISGIEGLYPTIKIIKHSKEIAIANKEAIICGWNLIKKELLNYNTKFIPVDSEHFSLWFALKNVNLKIEKIFLTASGGPFLNYSKKKINNVKISEAINHPNWKMGKKISIDSSTMMNKVFEVIEAGNIFDFELKKIGMLIHQKSYIHAIIKFKNGMIKIIAHDTTMKIPIFNSLYNNYPAKNLKTKPIDLKKLNLLSFKKIDNLKFPLVKILNFLPSKCSLYNTIIVAANDKLVELFLENKIKYSSISSTLLKFIKSKEFSVYKKKYPKNIKEITKLNNYVRLKIEGLSI